jgi:hypothetical protein
MNSSAIAELTSTATRCEETRELAYYRWVDRGCPTGDEWADWFAAEAALRAEPEPSAQLARVVPPVVAVIPEAATGAGGPASRGRHPVLPRSRTVSDRR